MIPGKIMTENIRYKYKEKRKRWERLGEVKMSWDNVELLRIEFCDDIG